LVKEPSAGAVITGGATVATKPPPEATEETPTYVPVEEVGVAP
jgi:hypothetical protein